MLLSFSRLAARRVSAFGVLPLGAFGSAHSSPAMLQVSRHIPELGVLMAVTSGNLNDVRSKGFGQLKPEVEFLYLLFVLFLVSETFVVHKERAVD